MKIIAIRADFGTNDVSDEEDVQTIVEKINIESHAEIQLDLSGCLIDYPATSMLTDAILNQLSLLPGKKKLEIISDYALPDTTILNWLFLGSEHLNMLQKKGLPYAEIIKIIEEALRPSNIMLIIKIRDNTGNVKHEFTIPKQ